ncbi:MAG TPA: restriction endonuclease subunit S [Pyrinomonadaceae bacterium]|jgi:type I restriction enzyme S subunit
MTMQSFFDNFASFSDMAGGVDKLRELILQLAFKGKLATQNPFDEPAADLVKRAIVEKAKSKYQTRLSNQEIQTDSSSDLSLPPNWTEVALGAVTNIIRGVTFPGAEKSREKGDGKIACLRTTNVQNTIEWNDMIYIPDKYIRNEEQFIYSNDILISMANSYELVGKVAQIKEIPQRATFGGFLAVIRTFGIDETYLVYLLRSPSIQLAFRRSSSQTTNIANISLSGIRPLSIPIAPIQEQKRIVAKVDELMRLCEELEERQHRRRDSRVRLNNATLAPLNNAASLGPKEFEQATIRLADNFSTFYDSAATVGKLRSIILQFAVHGKLVTQNSNDQSACALLEEIKKEKERQIREQKSKQIERLPAITENETLNYSIPNGWAWAWLGDLARFVDYRGKTPPKTESGVTLITAKNVRMGFISEHPREFISEETYREVMTRGFPKFGDILFTTEAPLGNVAQLLTNERIALAQRVIDLQVFKPLLAEYLKLNLMSPLMQNAIMERATGMTATGIKASKLKLLPIPLPPLAEQKRIVAKVNQLMSLCDELEIELRRADAASEKLVKAAIQHVLEAITEAHSSNSAAIAPTHEHLANA